MTRTRVLYKHSDMSFYLRKMSIIEAKCPLREMLSLGYKALARLLFETGVRHHQCCLKVMNADVARKLLDNVKNDGYVFDTEWIVLARKLNIPVQQVQVRWVDGRLRKSNLRWVRIGFTMMKNLFVLKASGLL